MASIEGSLQEEAVFKYGYLQLSWDKLNSDTHTIMWTSVTEQITSHLWFPCRRLMFIPLVKILDQLDGN